MAGFNSELANGTVIGQSVQKGRLVKNTNSITINVIKQSETPTTTIPNAPSEGEDTTEPTTEVSEEPTTTTTVSSEEE